MSRPKGWYGPLSNQGLGPRARQTHGCSSTPTYRSWVSMVQRCTNPENGRWASYGGAGVTVCERWRTFSNFLADMGERPAGTSIDRYPDKSGNYEPANCRWANSKEQSRNRRNNRVIEFMGRKKTLTEWAELISVPRETLLSRLDRGWSLDRAIGVNWLFEEMHLPNYLNLDPRVARKAVARTENQTRPIAEQPAEAAS